MCGGRRKEALIGLQVIINRLGPKMQSRLVLLIVLWLVVSSWAALSTHYAFLSG
jgi:hypothetical protein